MRAPGLLDLEAVARVLMAVPERRRRALLLRLVGEAGAARRYRAVTGRAHPRLGDGSLLGAALRRDPPAAPGLSDADFRRSLALALEALGPLASRRRGAKPR